MPTDKILGVDIRKVTFHGVKMDNGFPLLVKVGSNSITQIHKVVEGGVTVIRAYKKDPEHPLQDIVWKEWSGYKHEIEYEART